MWKRFFKPIRIGLTIFKSLDIPQTASIPFFVNKNFNFELVSLTVQKQ